jgi:hypothetical protein
MAGVHFKALVVQQHDWLKNSSAIILSITCLGRDRVTMGEEDKKLPTQILRILIMDIQLGSMNSKIEKVRRTAVGHMSSTPLSEHRANQCSQHRHRTASRGVDGMEPSRTNLQLARPNLVYSLISCLWKRPIAQSARSLADGCTSASHSIA